MGISVIKCPFTWKRGTRLLCMPNIIQSLLSIMRSTTGVFGVISLFCPGHMPVTRLLIGVASWVLMSSVVILLMASVVVLITPWSVLWLLSSILLSVK